MTIEGYSVVYEVEVDGWRPLRKGRPLRTRPCLWARPLCPYCVRVAVKAERDVVDYGFSHNGARVLRPGLITYTCPAGDTWAEGGALLSVAPRDIW